MWFNPSELSSQTTKSIANFANLANYTSNEQQEADKISRISKISSELSSADRQKLLDYMAEIDETDPEMIQELLDECAKDPDKLLWALGWADKVLANHKQPHIRTNITCGNCQHFEAFYPHGRGPGTCSAGITPYGICWWSETIHHCDERLITDKNRG